MEPPQVIVLDEPSSGLDPPQGVRELTGFLRTLPPDTYGMTVIFSTHQVDLVPEIADYVYVMQDGVIAGEGTPDEIFLREELLRGARLDVPPILARLLRSLRQNGVRIDAGSSYHEVEAELLRLLADKA